MAFTTIETPIGQLTIVGADGVVTGVYQEDHEPEPDTALFGERDDAALAEAAVQLSEYFAGERKKFTVPVKLRGTAFQERVWEVIKEIPYGETRTYGEVAELVGNPRTVRAVGLANRANPVTVIVPCHRVISATGKLNGYAGGVHTKHSLLVHEGAWSNQLVSI